MDLTYSILESRGYQVRASTARIGSDLHSDLRFAGSFMGEPAHGFAMFAEGGGLAKIYVVLETEDEEAIPKWERVSAQLRRKYGRARCVKEFTPPYFDGDGFEESALRTGKAQYQCGWDKLDLFLSIRPDLTVRIDYEPPGWRAESLRRAKARATANPLTQATPDPVPE